MTNGPSRASGSAKLAPAFLRDLAAIVGSGAVLTDPADCWPYGYDNSRRHAAPGAVVFATTTEQVARIVACCHDSTVSLVARGRGTGTAGGSVPFEGGVVLSLERMTRVLAIEPANRLMRVEAGITNQAVQEQAAAHGFFWPPDPTSSAFCSVGGNVAVNAAGPRAVKYGATRDNVLGLTAVTGTGAVIHTGVYTTKSVVGYDLTRLLIGSEGTLAIVTEATLKLTPLPETRRTLQAVYGDIHSATAAVVAIMGQPVIPCALEFMDNASIEMIRNYSQAHLPHGAGAMLMIELDGQEAGMDAAVAAVTGAARNDGLIRFTAATNREEVEALWATRKALSPALRNIAPNKLNEDVVVPVSRIPELIEGLGVLSREYGIPIVNFGHAGNGNIHVNLLYDTQDPQQERNALPCLSRVFDLVLVLGGTLSGEHGIGVAKRDYMTRAIDPATLRAMRAIKREFDPRGILNPGKVLPPETAADTLHAADQTQ
jgi:glycolate oxidase subunit GlcD